MKTTRLIAAILLAALICGSLSSCFGGEVTELTDRGFPGYYYEDSEGIVSITNYHPYKFYALPDYQELVQYGDGAGLTNEGTVYFVYVVDTSLEPDSEKAYYSAEFDGETGELLSEEGEYFADTEEKSLTVDKLLSMIKPFVK